MTQLNDNTEDAESQYNKVILEKNDFIDLQNVRNEFVWRLLQNTPCSASIMRGRQYC